MAEDLFAELDRFQQSIQSVSLSNAVRNHQEHRERGASRTQCDVADISNQRHNSGYMRWPQPIRSPTPLLDAFEDRDIQNGSECAPSHAHYGSQTTDRQPVSNGLQLNRKSRSAYVGSLDLDLYSSTRLPVVSGSTEPSNDPHHIFDDWEVATASKRSVKLPDSLSLRPFDVIRSSDQDTATRSAPSIHPIEAIKGTVQPPVVQGIRLVTTHELPDRLRGIFPFPLFNAVQSKCFGPVFDTNDNFVLSAPTGSGKTGVLELAICRLMTSSASDSFKIIYQAPTKSLCSERQRDWQSKFSRLGLQCAELTGDTTQNQLHEVQHASIIITTPEKWDTITRKWKDRQKLMQMIKLFLIDEVHILKEDRGATLEAVVSRMKSMGSDVRFVAISAAIPNLQDIATWLGKEPGLATVPARMEKFGEDFRPVKLQKHVCGFQGGANDFGFDKLLNGKLPDVIVKWSQRKPLMVFCSTRRSCVETAKLLSNWWMSRTPTDRHWGAPRRQIAVTDKDLHSVVASGVAFHHAGMTLEDRSTVEKSYLEGGINVVCCTSTLAIGVNLPCHMVIIKGTVTYQGQASGACREYSDLEIMQMLGRAGRPQFDNSAVAVIMTRIQRVADYERMITGQEVLESSLHQNLIDHINAEIGLGTVTDSASAKKWLMGTYLCVRLKANPKHYQLDGCLLRQSVDEQLEDFCAKAIGQLEQSQLVVCQPSPKCTEFGDAMARYCVRFDTMKAFLSLQVKPKVSEILSVMSQAAEFKEVRIRPGDKSLYRELNKHQSIKFPVSNSLESPAHKISLIIQSVLGAAELPTEDSKVRSDYQTCKAIIFNHISRLIRCIVDCQLYLCDSIGTRNALTLARSLGAQVWDDSPLHLKQLEGIGLIGVRKLVNANIKSIEDFQTAEAQQIERALSRNPPWGTQLQSKAAAFPRLRVSLTLKGEPLVKRGHGLTVRIKVDIGFLNEKVPGSFQRKAVYVCLLVDTTAGNVVHFGRISARKLGDGQEVLVDVTMTSVDQSIRAFVMCDEIAGTARQATLKPAMPIDAFRSVQLTSRHETQNRRASNEANTSKRRTSNHGEEDLQYNEFDDDEVADEDLVLLDPDEFMNIEDLDELDMSDYEPSKEVQQPKPQANASMSWEPQRLGNGNWACNHSCINKKTCKHRCCQQGLEKKPKAPKSTNIRRNGPDVSPTQQRLDLSLNSKLTRDAVTKGQPRVPAPGHKRSLQTAESAVELRKKPRVVAPTFVLPRATTQTRANRRVIPRFERTHAPAFQTSERDNVNFPSSDDEQEQLDLDLVRDSRIPRAEAQSQGDKIENDYSDDPDECMSGALPSIEGIESIDLSNDDEMNARPLHPPSMAPLASGLGPGYVPRMTDLDSPFAPGISAQKGVFVRNSSSSSNFSPLSDVLALMDIGNGDKIMTGEPHPLLQGNKIRKPSDVEDCPYAVDGEDKENYQTVAKSASQGDGTSKKPDHELDLEEWFHRYLGTEHFNYVG